MSIQWYPGHMHKAGKAIKEILPQIDVLIEVLDARIPFSSQNPMLASLQGDKPCIKVLSKSDLADSDCLLDWQAYLEHSHLIKTLAVSSEQPDKMRQLLSLCQKLVPHKAAGGHTINCLIMGIPNVGKSTLINVLAGRRIAKTGNEPSITKMLQQIVLDGDITLFDTPGMMWPKVQNPNSGFRLAATGAIKDTAISHDQIVLFAAEFMLHYYPESLRKRFQLAELPETELALLEIIGKQRGCLRAGGKVDIDKVAKIFLAELRAGTLGKFCLETPAMMIQELAELELLEAEKAAQKLAKKQAWKATN